MAAMKGPTRLIVMALVLAALMVGAMLIVRKVKGMGRNAPPPLPTAPVVTLDLGNGATMELVRIEPGEFEMGSDDAEEGHDSSESPKHKVKIAKPFYLGKFEVTQGQWEAVMNYNQAQMKGEAKQAVDSTGWADTQKFCMYAGQRAGRTFAPAHRGRVGIRLPGGHEDAVCIGRQAVGR